MAWLVAKQIVMILYLFAFLGILVPSCDMFLRACTIARDINR